GDRAALPPHRAESAPVRRGRAPLPRGLARRPRGAVPAVLRGIDRRRGRRRRRRRAKGVRADMTSTAEALTQRLAATPIVGLIGLGYVGLPLAVAFAESGATVIGLDVDPTRVPRFQARGLRAGEDFFLAFSPERIDPGNRRYTLREIPKVVGGLTPACRELAATLYARITRQVVPVSGPETAEMVKLFENTFRSV